MEGECNESGRVLVYQWKFKELSKKCTVMTEMVEFMGLKTFRFALKRVGEIQGSKTTLYFIGANLHKTSFKVAKVSVQIKDKPHCDGQMKARGSELDHLQLFVIEYDSYWQELEQERVTFTFSVHVVETLSNYRYQLSDVLLAEQLWFAAQNKQWTDVEFAVKSHIFSAHRTILAARSPILFVLVNSTKPGSRIKINHSNPIAFEIFLCFIYTGVFNVHKKRSINEEVLRLADQYDLTTLKTICELAVRDIDANDLTAFSMAMKPNFECCPSKPQLQGKTKSQLFFKEYFTVIECVWRVEELPDIDQVFTSVSLNFRNDGAFRAGLADHHTSRCSTLLSPQHYLYLACSHLEKTGTVVYYVDSYIDGTDCCQMDRRGEKSLYFFGREVYDLVVPSAFKFDIMIKETVSNYSYQLFDNSRTSHFWSMFESSLLTDMEFQVGEKSFFSHRVIVSSRSPVFEEMFCSPTVESITGQVRIDDVEPTVFREFLFFLYTGTLQVSANSPELLKVAERYEVSTLIQICKTAAQEVDVEEISTSLVWL